MIKKQKILKILSNSFWMGVAAGLIILLTAAIEAKKQKACAGFEIELKGVDGPGFLGRQEVIRMITNNKPRSITGKLLSSFDLKKMEIDLEKNVWIKEANLYFDNNLVLWVEVKERNPVVRLFNTRGQSVYLDEEAVVLPVSTLQAIRVPVFTGVPRLSKNLNKADSLFFRQVVALGKYINRDVFWKAQIAQINVTPGYQLELIPTVGKHLIEFGDGNDYEKKFNRLMVFYKQVLSKKGMDAYSTINVKFNGQVVGKSRDRFAVRTDSLLAVKYKENLLTRYHDSIADPAPPEQTIQENNN